MQLELSSLISGQLEGTLSGFGGPFPIALPETRYFWNYMYQVGNRSFNGSNRYIRRDFCQK